MITQNFTAIGRSPGESIFIHKDNVKLLSQYGYSAKVQCIGINFNTGEISDPILIAILLKFCPQKDVCSEGERQVISDLVGGSLSEKKIKELNQKFEEIKYQEGSN